MLIKDIMVTSGLYCASQNDFFLMIRAGEG